MKRLYEFTLKKKEQVEKEVPDVNKDGEEITAKKTVEEEVEKKFFLRRPTRAMLDEGELYYGVELGKACLLYTSPSPRDRQKSRMPSSA